MKKMFMIFTITGVVLMSTMIGFAEESNKIEADSSKVKDVITTSVNSSDSLERYQNMYEAMRNRDINAMKDFMDNLTDDEYTRMISDMAWYHDMSSMMKSYDRDYMIDMHNSMENEQSCH